MKGSTLGPLTKWGVGPYTDGLFTQSNFGIITRLTLWLRPKCSHFQSFIFQIDTHEKLAEVMDSWRSMTISGFNASLRIFNDVRMISFAQRFPDNESKPLSESARKLLRDKMKIGKWIGLGAVYPVSPLHAEADREYIKTGIGHLVDSLVFYDEATVAPRYEKADTQERQYLDFVFNKSLLRGNVSRAGLNMVYWRKPSGVRVGDLHEDGCGVLWYCPAIPFRGKDARTAVAICEKICLKYGFELNIGFLFISQRALDITGAICYDRNIKGEDRRAMACHNELMMLLNAEGYSPYRLGIQSMNMMKFKAKAMLSFQERLKEAIDPNGVLAPGHYELGKRK
jgi:4-cresol dehydrogenase (hydroxylating)